MPATKTATKTATPAAPELRTLDLGDLVEHPKNVRRDVGDVTELAASITEQGVLEPLIVTPNNDGTYTLIAGHRRLAAARIACVTDVPCIVRHDLADEADVITAMLVENGHRADLTPVEEAAAYQQLLDLGATTAQVAKRTGRAKTTVTSRLTLMRLPEGTRDKVHHRQITLEDAAALAEFTDDPETLDRLTKAAGTHEFRWRLQEARGKVAAAKTRAASEKVLADSGVRVVTIQDLKRGAWSHNLSRVLDADDVPGITDDTTAEQDAEFRRAAHADCPHHAAWLDSMGRIEYVCLQPSIHDDDTTDDGSDLDTAAEQAAAARRTADHDALMAQQAQDRQDCETAAAIRRTWILEHTTNARTISDAAGTALAHLWVNHAVAWYVELEPARAADFLGIELTDDYPHDADEAAKTVAANLTKRTGPQALLAALAALEEDNLTRAGNWHAHADVLQSGSTGRAWLDFLGEHLGYELTTWEADRLAAVDARAAELAAAQAAEEAAGDEDDAA